jgi:hypothetical protein
VEYIVFGLTLLLIGAYDFKRRIKIGKRENSRPEHEKFIAWNILTTNLSFGSNGRIVTPFPLDTTNESLTRIVVGGWYLRFVFLFGCVSFVAGCIKVF